MTLNSQWKINQSDLIILRDLAKKIRDIANSPVNQERKESWYKHNSLDESRPLVLIESGIALNELVTESDLKCQEGWARGLELGFRRTIYHFENIKDDEVVEPCINCNWNVSVSNYGCDAVYERGDSGTELSSYRWNPPIKDLHKDFDKLHPRTYSVNRESTLAWKS
ncbi:MAG: hypothetical protein ACPL7B_18140, partial [Candidatus Poribacteria bacterium]